MRRITRRWVVAACPSVMMFWGSGVTARSLVPVQEYLEGVRKRIGGRLGVHALDTESGQRIGLDDTSRYAMASTFKWLLAAAVLSRVDSGKLSLTQTVSFSERDMLSHAPMTSKLLPKGSATVRELCAAIVEVSDNPAANLLLKLIDGPDGLTRFIRTLGDNETRLDRYELDLNSNLPGDPRDTTTPRAMVGSMERVLTGNPLSPASRELLTGWMMTSTTGLSRIRAGVPTDWKAGDKTGTGARGAVNDVAIIWPPGRKPILMAVYMSESSLRTEALSAAHADIARATVSSLGK
jgi:beta-lactamase class A